MEGFVKEGVTPKTFILGILLSSDNNLRCLKRSSLEAAWFIAVLLKGKRRR